MSAPQTQQTQTHAATASGTPSVPLVDLRAQYLSIREDMDEAVQRVLHSCAFAGGPEVALFERAFATYCGTKHCIGVSSGTSALEIIFRAMGMEEGDEIITVPNTFFATAEGASILGVKPVFVDAEEDTALMDVSRVEAAITPKTKAIVPVHLYGQPADMDALLEISRRTGVPIVEDCAQAHGARYKGKRVGAFGIAAAFSFYPGKNLGAYGEAGGIVTSDASIDAFSRMFREHGSVTKYEHKIIARNDRLDGIQGAVLGAKLPHLEGWNASRRRLAARYRELLADEPRVRIVSERADREGVYHLFVVRVADRDRVRKSLNDAGVGAGIHYPVPLHLQECYRDLGHREGDFPATERLAKEILSLPLYPELTDEQVQYVVKTLKTAL